MRFESASVLYYRVFDIGDEVDLNLADNILKRKASSIRLVLSKKQRAIIINEPPLVLSLDQWQYEVGGKLYAVSTLVKLWSFGAISLAFKFQLPSGVSMEAMKNFACHLDSDPKLHALAKERTQQVVRDCEAAIKNPDLSDLYEDYMLFHIEKIADGYKLENILDDDNFYRLVLLDETTNPSRQLKDELAREVYQYASDDFALIDWNSAFIYDQSATMDIPDVIEFALCQLLEMQYYDDILTKRLNIIYKNLTEWRPSVFFGARYTKFWRQSAMFYRETSEVVETVENSLKVVGDFYYAKIFRVASSKFRFSDWKQTVDAKLENVAKISKMLSEEITVKRSEWLEIIIIILIGVEVIPLIWNYFSRLF